MNDKLDELARELEADREVLPVVVGPTATGKTALAITLAERIGGEIVSADSVQIYRHFDLGSGKPSAEERARAPHHLIDAIDPLEPIDAARFAEMANAAIEGVRARGRRPIVCGGTFLWIKAALFGLAEAPAAAPDVRERHRAIVADQGREALHAELARVDPAAAQRLHPNDVVRVSRALEVFELTGKSLLAWQAEHAFKTPKHRASLVGVRMSAEALTPRIEQRASEWLAQGWIDEVRSLVDRGYGGARAMGSVGFREVHEHLRGSLAREELLGAIVRSTRVFARRQRTWLNSEPVRWLEP